MHGQGKGGGGGGKKKHVNDWFDDECAQNKKNNIKS